MELAPRDLVLLLRWWLRSLGGGRVSLPPWSLSVGNGIGWFDGGGMIVVVLVCCRVAVVVRE
jgi:hypothetical protein